MNQDKFLELAKKKTKEFWHSYLKGEHDQLEELLQHAAVLDAEDNQAPCRPGNDPDRQMSALHQKLFIHKDQICREEWYEAQLIAERVCVVYGGFVTDINALFSMICREENGEIILCHMHHSLSLPGRPEETASYIILSQTEVMLERYRMLQMKSSLDVLTGVYNRGFIEDLIDRCLKISTGKCAFIMIDLDNFKQKNDLKGHVYGDRLLVKFAQFLKNSFLDGGEVGRIGGDEFCVFIRNIVSEENVEKLLKTFFEMLEKEASEENHEALSCSAGICFSRAETKSFLELYDRADQAMYRAKKENKGSYLVYQESL